MRMDMCIDMCMNMCKDMCLDMCMDLCLDMCMEHARVVLAKDRDTDQTSRVLVEVVERRPRHRATHT